MPVGTLEPPSESYQKGQLFRVPIFVLTDLKPYDDFEFLLMF